MHLGKSMSAVSKFSLTCSETHVDQSVKQAVVSHGSALLGRVVLSAFVLLAAILARPALAQTAAAKLSITPPLDLISAASVPGAFAKVSAMWGQGENTMLFAFLTQEDLDHMMANQPMIGLRYALIVQSTQSALRFVSEQHFQQMARLTRGQLYTPQVVAQADASFNSQVSAAQPGKSASVSLRGEQLVVDETDCLAKVVSSHYNVGDRTLPMALLTAYVRIDGQLFTIHAGARDDNVADRTWLRNTVIAWIRGLPKARQ
jgi:hypothetical protein